MSKAEDRAAKKALEKFPILFGERMGYDKTNLQQERRNAYEKGYHQAEKDLELTWDDISVLNCLLNEVEQEFRKGFHEDKSYIGYCKEVLKRFKDFKENNEL